MRKCINNAADFGGGGEGVARSCPEVRRCHVRSWGNGRPETCSVPQQSRPRRGPSVAISAPCKHSVHWEAAPVVRKRNRPEPETWVPVPECHYLGREAIHRIRAKKKKRKRGESGGRTSKVKLQPAEGTHTSWGLCKRTFLTLTDVSCVRRYHDYRSSKQMEQESKHTWRLSFPKGF